MTNSLWSRPAPDKLASYMIIVPDHVPARSRLIFCAVPPFGNLDALSVAGDRLRFACC
jgi:hypothetical protein